MPRFPELPKDRTKLIRVALDLVERCRASAGQRSAYYRALHQLVETGKNGDGKSLLNMCYAELDRTASHLFSPTDLRFDIDFEYEHPSAVQDRGRIAARHVTRIWERTNADTLFAQGVFESLKYGACIFKQWVETDGEDKIPSYRSGLVMPWQFGVYREDQNDLNSQYALCETIPISMPEVWHRIHHLPDADTLFKRIQAHASRNMGDDGNSLGSNHPVLSTSQINTSGLQSGRSQPGGIVQLTADGSSGFAGPLLDVEMVKMHELWVQDGEDYTTVQIIEPDILIAPLFRHTNLLIQNQKIGLQPYGMIQPNVTSNYLWGRPELTDIMELQGWLSRTADDSARLLGLQIDKILAVEGEAMPDEDYDKMRLAGVVNVPNGSKISDITPRFPPEVMPMMEFQMRGIERMTGFDNMLSGRGESGVRSAQQSSGMMRAASPRLKDRSLLVERQCAAAADLTLSLAQYKDGRNYWTDPDKPDETVFLLADLPEDRRITVDSHSTSPVFADDNRESLVFGLKAGVIDPISFIERMKYQNSDVLIQRFKEKQKTQQAQMEELKKTDPEAWAKALSHGGKGR